MNTWPQKSGASIPQHGARVSAVQQPNQKFPWRCILKHVVQLCGLLVMSHVDALAACDPTLGDTLPLFENQLAVSGRGQVVRRLLLPAGRDVIVMAAEKGIDVNLTVTGEDVVGYADSPLRRFGVQRVLFRPVRGTAYSAMITGKESAAASGTVNLRVVPLSSTPATAACVAAHRRLATADAAYARGQAITNNIAPAAASDAGQVYRSSADAYRDALTALQTSGDSVLYAQIQYSVAATMYQGVRDWTAAEFWSRKAANSYRAIGDPYGAAKAQAMQAASLMEMKPMEMKPSDSAAPQPAGYGVPGNLVLAGDLLTRVAAFHAERGELYDQALATNNLGIMHYLAGQFLEATHSYRTALDLYRRLQERTKQTQVIGNLALVEYELGNLSKANALYAELRGLIGAEESPELYVNVLNNSALVLRVSGQSDRALDLYETALAVARRMQDIYYEAVSLQGMGTTYETLGDLAVALEFFRRALTLRTPALDSRLRVETLSSIANIQRLNGYADESLRLDLEALSLAATPLARARIRLQVALDYEAVGKLQKMKAELDRILKSRTSGDDLICAKALLLRGRTQSANGDSHAAEADLRAALRTFRKYDSATDEFGALIALAVTLRHRGDTVAAMREADAALALAEQMRLQSSNPELRATLLQSLRPAFDLKIAMLADSYAAASSTKRKRKLAMQALQTAERGRARSLEDYERIDFAETPTTHSLLGRRRLLYGALAQFRIRLDADAQVMSADDKLLDAIRLNIADTKQQLDQIDAELTTLAGPGRALATDLPIDLIPVNTGLVEYWLGAEQSYAWVVTRDVLKLIRLGSTGEILSTAVAAQQGLRDFNSTTRASRVAQLERLSTLVWNPVRQYIGAKRTLVFVPDMSLHYIPFAALVNTGSPQRFLVEDFDVATAPSLRLLLAVQARRTTGTGGLLMIDDPVYGTNDPRVQFTRARQGPPSGTAASTSLVAGGPGSRVGMQRLHGAAREAEAIIAIVTPAQTERLQGLAATKERFLKSPLEQYRYIHVASHAIADAQIPQLSALLLTSIDSQGRPIDGRVLAADLMNVRLNADVVVLSACDTALGRVISGEGMVGLRYVMLARGARTVASSLWKVQDRAAADLMSRFYASMFREHASALAALSGAMRVSLKEREADPALWAAFDLSVRDMNLIH
jgi:CHAT domain-containing protein